MTLRKYIITGIGVSYRKVLKPVLFRFDPEFVHEKMVDRGEMLGKFALTRGIFAGLLQTDSPLLRQSICGMNFVSPVGLSAGFDYNAKLTQILPALGFGFATVGTITNLPYGGNPPPMLGRLPKSRSLMVNKGFKNLGAKAIGEKLNKFTFAIPIGISIGRTNSPQLQTAKESTADIVKAFELFERAKVDNSYYELNISCPNLIHEVENFYETKNLQMLMEEMQKLHINKPVFVKMPIDRSDKETLKMTEIIIRYGLAGVIFGNLQKNRNDPGLVPSEVAKFQTGNFSGKPTEKRSNELIKLVFKTYGKKLTIIGTGGIFSAEDAYRKIRIGASLVQLITGMIFQGPQLIAEINMGLVELLKRDGFKNISDAVGRE